ncbi:hypothetical protein ACVWWM_003113 [Ewingella americana]
MIALLIRWSIANRFLVLMATLFIAAAGIWAINTTPVGCPAGPLRRAGDCAHQLSGASAANR